MPEELLGNQMQWSFKEREIRELKTNEIKKKRKRKNVEETFFHKSLDQTKIEKTRTGGEKKEMEKKKKRWTKREMDKKRRSRKNEIKKKKGIETKMEKWRKRWKNNRW